jgi:hypothetical protein
MEMYIFYVVVFFLVVITVIKIVENSIKETEKNKEAGKDKDFLGIAKCVVLTVFFFLGAYIGWKSHDWFQIHLMLNLHILERIILSIVFAIIVILICVVIEQQEENNSIPQKTSQLVKN